MKIYLNTLNEQWVIDRFKLEWSQENKEITTANVKEAQIIWLIAPWTWKKVPKKYLKTKKVICSIYHIDEKKFDDQEKKEFYKRDKFVDEYHAISLKSKEQLQKLTTKPITSIPFWVNEKIWFQSTNLSLRKKYKLNEKSFLVGSFQRDTEGKDLMSPKLSKGPDLFLEIVSGMFKKNNNIEVVLTGKRRNYIINGLKDLSIPFYYFEMVDFKQINELYNCLDLYVVSSRYEGGPQSIVECGITKTPIVSTRVGIAEEILSDDSLFDVESFSNAKPNIDYAYNNARNLAIPKGFVEFRKLFKKIYEI